ncbi:MAG: putative peptide zinc metalloprotease protein [Actinomycetota bacterium]|jgi:putative peptide zinc metalloprotease protein|nr:putative peptide zinc metalloprotease protein [Actinomycetota bacterium]
MTSSLRARPGRFVVSLLAVLIPLSALGMPAAHADEGSNSGNTDPVNLAYAVNQTDGSSIFELAFQIVHITGDTVDPTNAAIAFSSCTGCRTVAVAIQIVIYDDNPSTFTPGNGAAAVNSACESCITIADAYQFVFAGGPDVHLSNDGRRQLKVLKRQLADLGDQVAALSPDELQARIDAIAQQILQVVSTELVARGQGHADTRATTTTSVNNTLPTNAPTSSTSTPDSTSTTALTTSTTA